MRDHSVVTTGPNCNRMKLKLKQHGVEQQWNIFLREEIYPMNEHTVSSLARQNGKHGSFFKKALPEKAI